MFAIVAAWAFAEAILFFLVADVPISWIAVRRGWRAGVLAAVVAALAAAAGGAVTYAWAASEPAGATRAIVSLPAIDPAMVTETAHLFGRDGYSALLAGSLSGVPYKLFALAAGHEGRPLLPFLLLSFLFRLPRFLGAALTAAALSRWLADRLSVRARLWLLGGFWLLFYGLYFALMPG